VHSGDADVRVLILKALCEQLYALPVVALAQSLRCRTPLFRLIIPQTQKIRINLCSLAGAKGQCGGLIIPQTQKIRINHFEYPRAILFLNGDDRLAVEQLNVTAPGVSLAIQHAPWASVVVGNPVKM
jgi:hypothetical protein